MKFVCMYEIDFILKMVFENPVIHICINIMKKYYFLQKKEIIYNVMKIKLLNYYYIIVTTFKIKFKYKILSFYL